jgi:hypothetical protein
VSTDALTCGGCIISSVGCNSSPFSSNITHSVLPAEYEPDGVQMGIIIDILTGEKLEDIVKNEDIILFDR